MQTEDHALKRDVVFFMAKKNKVKAKGGGVVSRQTLYQVASKYSKEAIETLYDLMLHGSQEGVRLGAARALLDKALPDVKSVEITGEDHGPLLIKIIEDTRTNTDE